MTHNQPKKRDNRALIKRLFRRGGTPTLEEQGIRYFVWPKSKWIDEQEALIDQDREIAEIDRNRETALADMARD